VYVSLWFKQHDHIGNWSINKIKIARKMHELCYTRCHKTDIYLDLTAKHILLFHLSYTFNTTSNIRFLTEASAPKCARFTRSPWTGFAEPYKQELNTYDKTRQSRYLTRNYLFTCKYFTRLIFTTCFGHDEPSSSEAEYNTPNYSRYQTVTQTTIKLKHTYKNS
jgi:hypothetical protein